MNEEAGFIAALLAEPDDRTVLLVYADWLDERADPRAEYLRLIVTEKPSKRRLSQLRRPIDRQWIRLIDTRYFRIGIRVRITEGSFAQSQGDIIAVAEDRQQATVCLTFWGRPLHWEAPLAHLELAVSEA